MSARSGANVQVTCFCDVMISPMPAETSQVSSPARTCCAAAGDAAARATVKTAAPMHWYDMIPLSGGVARAVGVRTPGSRSSFQLARDKLFGHLARLVGLRTRLSDPFVDGIFEQAIVALAAGGLVGLGELLLHWGQHVIVECALHDKERHQVDLFLALENLLRIALVDRLPRIEEHLVVFHHALVAAPLRVLIACKSVADRRTHRNVGDGGVDVRRGGKRN